MKKLSLLALLVPALSLAIYDMKWFDLNHWSAPFYNDGPRGARAYVGSPADPPAVWLDSLYGPQDTIPPGMPTDCHAVLHAND